MIRIPKESDFPRKQEADHNSSDHEKAKASSSTTSIKPQWVRLKDPRIVRVARAYGGKDRHSKVCTIRGLRDRRVRLSVPTAIQLYDLQERLGFNQPSKVIDWLLDAAKHEIDELPPLPPLNLALIHHRAILTSNSQPNEEDGWEASNNTFWKLIEPKEASSSGEMVAHDHEEQANDDEVKQGSNINTNELYHGVQVMPHHHPPFLGYQWEGSGGGGEGVNVSHQTDLQGLNVVPFSSTLSLSTGDSSHFPSHFGASMDMDNIPRQINNTHYHLLGSSPNLYPIPMVQSMKPFGLSIMTPNTTESQSHNQQDFPSK